MSLLLVRGARIATAAFSPLDIAGLQLWLDASDASTLFQDAAKTTPATLDGDVIGAWADKSGNGNDATQATTAKKPILKLAIQNGRNVVRFDGVDDNLVGSIGFAGAAFTVFAVLTRRVYTTFPAFIAEYNGATNGYLALGGNDANPNTLLSISKTGVATATSNLATIVGTFDIIVFKSAGVSGGDVNVDVWRNGTPASSTLNLTGLSTNAAYNAGASKNGTADFLGGDQAEILLYNSALSVADMNRVGNYLEHWGLVWVGL